MRFKRLLALLVSAALALSLLAGCGGGKALSQVIVDLLDGLYANVSVEADSDLTAALKQAAAEGGTEEEILSRMIEILNHNGGSITFTRLGSGQQGDHAVTLYFQTGTDPDAAARNALAQWAGTLGTLPDDGSYQGDVAMIEAENGYYIALDVEVLKAGKPDKPDKDEDDSTPAPGPTDVGFANDNYSISGTEEQKTFNVKTGAGLVAWTNYVRAGNGNTNCTLEADVTLTDSWEPIGNDEIPYTGTFDGGGHTITGLTVKGSDEYAGLFGYIGENGTVKDVTLKDVNIESNHNLSDVGGVAGNSWGTIENCSVSGGSVSGYSAGGMVGSQWDGSITGCSSSATVKGVTYAGGIAGSTNSGASLTGCYATGNVTLVSNDIGTWYAGGVVGNNGSSSTLKACYATGSVTGSGSGTIYTGGVTGSNDLGTLTACYHAKGTVKGSDGATDGATGGVAGRNYKGLMPYGGIITACYWGDNSQTQGIGEDQVDTGGTTQVTDGDWQTAVNGMNNALTSNDYKWELGADGLPVLQKKQ